jgi:hypothetical protein
MEARFGHDFSRVRVHTDARAAESAQAIQSSAYTVGHSLVFNRGRYRPDTAEGVQLLAHELTHVVQQQGGATLGFLPGEASSADHRPRMDWPRQRDQAPRLAQPSFRMALPYLGRHARQDYSLAPPPAAAVGAPPSHVASFAPTESPAEREAGRVARDVAAGRKVRVTGRAAGGAVQRSVLGSLAGLAVGAGTGVALGAIFGPLGMAIGGIVGGIVGLIKGAAESANERKLLPEERAEAQRVFGPSLDYERVRVAVSRVLTFPSHARTPYETVYLPPNTIPDPADLSDDLIGGTYFKALIHELCHVWQTQHGIGATRKLFSAIRGKYEYGGPKALRKAWAEGKHFLDFGLEQQCEICADYYERLREGRGISAFRPYIHELREGGRRLAPGLVPSSEPGDFPTPGQEEPAA